MMKRVLGAMMAIGVVLSSASVFAAEGGAGKTIVPPKPIVPPKKPPIVCPKECYEIPPDYHWVMRKCPPQCYNIKPQPIKPLN
jgi:hypothetical protein